MREPDMIRSSLADVQNSLQGDAAGALARSTTETLEGRRRSTCDARCDMCSLHSRAVVPAAAVDRAAAVPSAKVAPERAATGRDPVQLQPPIRRFRLPRNREHGEPIMPAACSQHGTPTTAKTAAAWAVGRSSLTPSSSSTCLSPSRTIRPQPTNRTPVLRLRVARPNAIKSSANTAVAAWGRGERWPRFLPQREGCDLHRGARSTFDPHTTTRLLSMPEQEPTSTGRQFRQNRTALNSQLRPHQLLPTAVQRAIRFTASGRAT
jgi:hypothetical protein